VRVRIRRTGYDVSRMEPLVEHTLEVDGWRTRALELEGEGPPLVLLHGYSDSADTWRLVLDRLARERRRAIAVDLPGFAQASPLGDGPIMPQLDGFARAVIAEHADGEPAVVAGNSLGGCVALRLASAGDASLAGIVPIAPAGLDMARWFAVIETDPLVRALLALPVPGSHVLVEQFVSRFYRRMVFARPGAVPDAVVRSFARHLRDRSVASGYLATGRRLLPELRVAMALDRITCPVLVIWGDRDRFVPSSGAQRITAELDGHDSVRVELLERCGHCPQLEEAGRVADLLLGFPFAEHAAQTADPALS
jgi:pimeloyl-ACP methyl ester carboxylesterase